MYTMNITNEQQAAILQLIAGILHLGNIAFEEVGNYAQPANDDCEFSLRKYQWGYIIPMLSMII